MIVYMHMYICTCWVMHEKSNIQKCEDLSNDSQNKFFMFNVNDSHCYVKIVQTVAVLLICLTTFLETTLFILLFVSVFFICTKI